MSTSQTLLQSMLYFPSQGSDTNVQGVHGTHWHFSANEEHSIQKWALKYMETIAASLWMCLPGLLEYAVLQH